MCFVAAEAAVCEEIDNRGNGKRAIFSLSLSLPLWPSYRLEIGNNYVGPQIELFVFDTRAPRCLDRPPMFHVEGGAGGGGQTSNSKLTSFQSLLKKV